MPPHTMATIANLSIKMSLDSQKLNVDLGKVRGQLSMFGKGGVFAGLRGNAESWLKGLPGQLMAAAGAYVSVSTAIQQVAASMERVDRQAKLSDRLGIQMESTQRLHVAAQMSGTDIEVLAKAMLHMNKTVGSGGKTLDRRLFDVAKQINAISDPAKRAARQLEVFGKQGFELSEFIRQAGRIERTTAIIDRFGLAISRLDAAKLEAANDSMTKLRLVVDGLSDKFAVSLSPAIEQFAELALTTIDSIGNSLDVLGVKWDHVGAALGGIIGQLDKIEKHPIISGAMMGGWLLSGKAGPTSPSRSSPGFGAGGVIGESKHPGAFEKGSKEAASAILAAGGDPISALHKTQQEALRVLQRIDEHSDPMQAAAGGRGGLVREGRI